MSRKVYVTGIGIISSIGRNVPETFLSLMNGIDGIGPVSLFASLHQGKLPAAEVKLSNEALLEITGNKGRKDFTRTTLLGLAAAHEAITSAGILDITTHPTGLISATTVGGMDRSEHFFAHYLDNPKNGKLIDIVNHDCADSTERIAASTGIRDFITTISTACSSSANSIMFGSNLIRSGQVERVLAGGTDAFTKFTLNGFNTLMILDKNGCRPFDENRAGLTLGEGAAYLVLESEDLVRERGVKPLAVVSGYGNANDAYHQTASSPDGTGAYLAMNAALRMSGLTPGDISYINVHGTGTQNNDLSEGIAIERIFGDKVPLFSSTKTFTGHTLGAAGSVEAVISVLSIQNNVIFPNLRFETPMKELKIRPVTQLMRNVAINHVLSNSFGFGGNNSSLILSQATN